MRANPLIVLAATVGGLSALGAAPAPITLESPVACEGGRSCFVQNYGDHDPGPGVSDYQCGGETYDGHDGTDFRLPDMAAQRAGVSVRAAAAGVVRGVRDGEPDVSIRQTGRDAVKGKECGNGVMVDHGEGWSTQYCHMARGSILVKPGQVVAVGQSLGRVGLSGLTEFPHLHLTVRLDEATIDPFAYGAPAGACGKGRSLWSKAAAAQFLYRSPELLNLGFTNAPVTSDGVETGDLPGAARDGAALVAYARVIGLKKGDVVSLSVIAPDGSPFATSTSPPLDRDKAQWMLSGGRKKTGGAFAPGTYRATATVERGGRTVLARRFEVRL